MRKIVFAFAFAGAVGLWAAPLVSADEAKKYEGGAVSGGGSIAGKITFEGAAPAGKEFALAKFPNSGFCAKSPMADGKGNIILQEVKVKGGALQDVVVYISDIAKGKPFEPKGADVNADTCRFLVQGGSSTFSGVIANKTNLRVLNTDADPTDPKAATGVLHNPHTYEVDGTKSKTIFNVPLPNKGQTIDKEIKLRKADEGSFVKLECDQHNFMNAYFLPVANPYYAVVKEDGTFKIDDIPAGEYEVEAWHPILGKVEKKIKVAGGGTAAADFAFKK